MKDRVMTENEASVKLEVIRAGLLSGTDVKVVSSEENIKSIDAAIDAIEEIQQYRAIGTPEECRAAIEKQTAKRLRIMGNAMICPSCPRCFKSASPTYCPSCGQKLKWEDEE